MLQQIGPTDRYLRVTGDIKAPEVIRKVDAEYPPSASDTGIEGIVIADVRIERDGSIADVRIVKSLSADFDEKAVAAIRQWKFKPATYLDKPVPVVFTVTVNFHR